MKRRDIKRLLCFALCVCTLMLVSACGTDSVQSETPTPGTAAQTPAPVSTPVSDVEESVFPESGYVMNLVEPSCSQAIVTSEAVYSAPSELSERVNYDYKPLKNTYCLVIAECVAYTEEDWKSGKDIWAGARWTLVSFIADGAPQSDMGWVPSDSCVEYNEETKTSIAGPLTAPGATAYSLSEDREPLTLTETDILYVSDMTPNEDGYVKASWLGSAGCWIKPEDLVFPVVGDSYFK